MACLADPFTFFLGSDVDSGTMLKSEIKPRTEYAMREKRTPGTPSQRVRIIEHVRGNKWKPEWIDPNPGLIHYVEFLRYRSLSSFGTQEFYGLRISFPHFTRTEKLT